MYQTHVMLVGRSPGRYFKMIQSSNLKIYTSFATGTGLYTQVVCQVLPGRRAASMDITPEGYGVVDRFHTKHHKYNSLQTSPQWKDAPTVRALYYKLKPLNLNTKYMYAIPWNF